MFLKKFCVSFYLWNNFSFRNNSLGLVHYEEKNVVQLIFDDSLICYASKIDVFLSSFVLVFTKRSTFT